MNNDPKISVQGNDPNEAVQRLAALVDKMIKTCPEATILVAMPVPTMQTASESSPGQEDRTKQYCSLIPGMVAQRQQQGSRVITVDFSNFPLTALNSGGVHLTSQGYNLMGDWWYDFIHQIPTDWIESPDGALKRPKCDDSSDGSANGGPDPNIGPPKFPPSVIKPAGKGAVKDAAQKAYTGGFAACDGGPHWYPTGQIALGIGQNGDWQYNKNWVEGGQIVEGIHRGSSPVHLADINNDGKADYLWVRTCKSLVNKCSSC